MGNSWISKYNFGCCDTSVPLFNQQDYGANGTACFDPSLLPAEDVFYVNSIYWSITTLTTIGYGDITPCNEMEMLYTALSHLLGSALFAYVVGGIATVAMTVIVPSPNPSYLRPNPFVNVFFFWERYRSDSWIHCRKMVRKSSKRKNNNSCR